ncbi:hypothetical protein K469DRAFT_759886 [Zopfia rhizophila CBS 207.26]|uniref:Uncharacterized protein n=1 Tax=Zopfia rhizophila CBS 207.26 TaxID=1314779 RepID=A0A6A6EJD9_9PEZI|nr:hypothetical protein K469DRAFT_759886 [Zopfia rhizophila CBS 207.26]
MVSAAPPGSVGDSTVGCVRAGVLKYVRETKQLLTASARQSADGKEETLNDVPRRVPRDEWGRTWRRIVEGRKVNKSGMSGYEITAYSVQHFTPHHRRWKATTSLLFAAGTEYHCHTVLPARSCARAKRTFGGRGARIQHETLSQIQPEAIKPLIAILRSHRPNAGKVWKVTKVASVNW